MQTVEDIQKTWFIRE